jgi:hypothetical protein
LKSAVSMPGGVGSVFIGFIASAGIQRGSQDCAAPQE